MRKIMKRVHCFMAFLLLFFFCSAIMYAQQKTVSGVVSDAKTGETVIGAGIRVKENTSVGTSTNLDGKFTLNIPENSKTLVISYLGYNTQELPIDRTDFEIKLEENYSTLEEVVVIGYGTALRRDVNASVASMKSEAIAKIPITNAAQAMTGRMAGVRVLTSDGSPDAEVMIRVRGGGSITGDNTPLYIVDGFPVRSLSEISLDNIESIDVLKDAVATAIYGSQGANGVILLTTRKAEGGKTRIALNSFMQSKTLSKKIPVLNPYEYVLLNYEYAALSGSESVAGFERHFGAYGDLDLYKYQKGTDWQQDMFGANLVSQQYALSVTGGSDKTKFIVNSAYNKDSGLVPGDYYQRVTGSFKIDHQVAKKLRFIFGGRLSDIGAHGNGTAGGTYKVRTSSAFTKDAVKGLDAFKVVDITQMTDDEYQEWLNSNRTLAQEYADYWKHRNQRVFHFDTRIEWDIVKNLKLIAEGGYEYGFNETKNYWAGTTTTASYVDGRPLVEWTKENRNSWRQTANLNYNLKINDNNRFDVLAGTETKSSGSDNTWLYAAGFSESLSPEKIFANLGLGEGARNLSSTISPKTNMLSYLGRFNYYLMDKYSLSFTFRADGSSRFAKENQWGYFPAGALAWRISDEPFLIGAKNWLSNLKIRATYGMSGNDGVPSGATVFQPEYSIKTTKTYGLGDVQNNFYQTGSTIPNPKLQWESMITQNLGLDFGFLRERISGSVEYYKNTTKDLILQQRIPSATGYTTQYENIGQTTNKGVEFTLNTYILEHKNYSLSANFNISYNHSNVDKLNDMSDTMDDISSGWAGTDLKGQDDYRIMVGHPVGLIYGWVTDGYYTTNDFERYDETAKRYILKDGVPSTGLYGGRIGIRPGALKLKDISGPNGVPDGIIDENDRTIIGNATPKIYGGFGLDATFYNFDLSVMFNFVTGNDLYNANKIASMQQYRNGSYPNMLDEMRQSNRYTYLAADGSLVTDLVTLAAMNENGQNSKEYWSPYSFSNTSVLVHSWAVEDASFLRLQNVNLGYTVPKQFTSKFAAERLRIYCTLNNVWVWTKYTGYDPEISSAVRGSSVSGLTPGVDYSTYPKSFSWTAGINLTF
jgi:TonB-linked SusC/RagA family outer membrane protein